MSEVKNERIKIVLGGNAPGKLVRFSYLHVHAARLNTQSGKMEYGVTALIPKTNVEDAKAVKEAVETLKKKTWLDHKLPIPPSFWNPLRDGDKDTKQDGTPLGAETRGHWVVNCKTDTPPAVVGTTKDAKGALVAIEPSAIKSGDWGRLSISLYGYRKGLGGVGAGLSNVQLVRQGDPLSGRTSAEDDFGAFEDMDSEIDPLA